MHRTLTMPALGTGDAVTQGTGDVTEVNQLRGSTAEQPRNGVALANVPQVVTFERGAPSPSWGWLSQTMPDTILVPTLDGPPVTAQEWMQVAQAAAPRGGIPDDQRVTITTTEPIDGDGRANVVRHEMAGIVADQLVTLAAQQPMHYVANALAVDGATGEAVSRFDFYIDDARRAPLVKMRVLATHCWLRRAEAEEQGEEES